MAQLNYPVQNMLDRTWSLWANDIGNDTLVSTMLRYSDCDMILGNPWCGIQTDYNLCNETYEEYVQKRYCGEETLFETATLKDLVNDLVWPRNDPVVGLGMEKLWYTSETMTKHQPRPKFHLYIANQLNSTAGMNVVHSALYARQYGNVALQAGINFTIYYTDYIGMKTNDEGSRRLVTKNGQTVFNYRSSHDWIEQPMVKTVERGSQEEQLLYHCLALSVEDCVVAPSGTLSKECKAEVDKLCGRDHKRETCSNCVHRHVKQLIDARCPPANEGGAKTVIEHCESDRVTIN